MQTLIVDGYNVIHAVPSLALVLDTSLEKARSALGSYLHSWKKTQKAFKKIIVVFDGKENVEVPPEAMRAVGGVEFVFSRGKEDADRAIIRLLKNAPHPERMTVITNDNYISNHCRIYHAVCKPVSFLVRGQSSRQGKSKKREKGTSKEIHPKVAQDINTFLKDVWNIT